MPSLVQVNLEEKRRIERLRKRMKQRAALPIHEGPQRGRGKRATQDATYRVDAGASSHILGLTPQGVIDAIQHKIQSRLTAEAMKQPGVVHVKNGKPLTAHGAKLLGVPWPPQ